MFRSLRRYHSQLDSVAWNVYRQEALHEIRGFQSSHTAGQAEENVDFILGLRHYGRNQRVNFGERSRSAIQKHNRIHTTD